MDEVTLKVKEARINEVGRGIVRIDPKIIKELGVTTGDIVMLEGKRKAAGIVWPGPAEDYGRNVIRVDGILRHNAGVAIDEELNISKTEASDAKEIHLAPQQVIEFSEDFIEYVHERIINIPLMHGNSVVIEVMGTTLPLAVISTKPKGVARITEDTVITISKKPVKTFDVAPGLRYEDIGGLRTEIETIREMIEIPIKHPEVFKKLGIKPPKGVIMHGPPGTGKTLLARAVANETDAHFISLNGPEIMSKYYGQSEENLRDVFKDAQEHAPSIIFIDEIDSIAPSREEVSGEMEKRIVSQLLTLMDGLESRGEIVVIAATNRIDALDPALRRPGRFDLEIEIGVPDRDGRKEIFQIHTRGMPLDNVELNKLADKTYGYTGADIEFLCKEAAMKALKRIMPDIKKAKDETLSKNILDKIKVTNTDYEEALNRVEPSAMREISIEIPNIKWADVGGLESVKAQLKESIEWSLKYPDLFKETGVSAPKGVLLYGPPGNGKTMLAKAVATESGVNFISIKGPELLNKYVGESEKGVRKIFRKARQVAPAILFFDELDSLVPKRGQDFGSDVTEKVVAQLLTEIDGVSDLKGVMLIGATNRPDLLDDALMRPGRLDKIIYVGSPEQDTRKKIFEVQTKGMNIDGSVKTQELAELTEGYSGADITAVCREAGLNSIRESIDANKEKPKAKKVTMAHFKKALDQVKPSFSEEEKTRWEEIRKKIGERGASF